MTRSLTLAVACGLGFVFAIPAHAAGHGTEAWRDFARRSMMPDYAWSGAPSAQDVAPRLRDNVRMSLQDARHVVRLFSDRGGMRRSLNLAVDRGYGSGAAQRNHSSTSAPDLTVRLTPLRSQLFDASYEQDLGVRGRIGVSALIAQQQYATPGFGLLGAFTPNFHDTAESGKGEISHGQGMRVDYRLPLNDRVTWRANAQSRLDMRSFESIHGIYAEPGDFDLPARLGAQVEWQVSADFALSFGVDRVYYGAITPFTSPALPARLLSLMADGSAPAFAWEDLTVYSLEGQLDDRWRGQWTLRYTTRQQPSASVDMYQQVLESEYTNINLMLGYQRDITRTGALRLTASYAPSMAFLGPGPAFSSRTYSRGAVAELEAAWVMAF
ncbi:MAG TPA: hypothetical protein VFN29_03580 [Chiayiivirga sp.]|nr:hypothetical protein [Chiayiivirga sp.]